MIDINGLKIVEVPGVTTDTARELMFHHLGLAGAYFEACGQDKEANREELHRQFALTFVGEASLLFRAATAFVNVLHDTYDEIDRDIAAQGFPKLDPKGAASLETVRLPEKSRDPGGWKHRDTEMGHNAADREAQSPEIKEPVKGDGTHYRVTDLRDYTAIERATLRAAKILDMNDKPAVEKCLGVRLYIGQHGTKVIIKPPAKSNAEKAREIAAKREPKKLSTLPPVAFKPDRMAKARAAKAAMKAKRG